MLGKDARLFKALTRNPPAAFGLKLTPLPIMESPNDGFPALKRSIDFLTDVEIISPSGLVPLIHGNRHCL